MAQLTYSNIFAMKNIENLSQANLVIGGRYLTAVL